MSTQRFKVALNAANFPFISSDQARVAIVPSLDAGPRIGRAFVGTEDSTDYNVPQLLYCENVVPRGEGLKSVSYRTVIPAYSDPT